jgi:DNA polymerase-3 subunit alpha
MEKFAGYGFNKSHSAAYALISYQTAWLKSNYPTEFMAAVLSSDMDNTDKVVIFLEDVKALGIEVLPPDVNHSQQMFSVVKEGVIRYGLSAVKGVGHAAAKQLVNARPKEGFKSLLDVCASGDKVNKKMLDSLIKSGACDVFGENRATLLASIELASQTHQQQSSNAAQGQMDLLGAEEADFSYKTVKDLPKSIHLQQEKETLGYYLSGHPVSECRDELKTLGIKQISQVSSSNSTVKIAGVVNKTKVVKTKKGGRIAFVELSDDSGKIDVAFFDEVYTDAYELLNQPKVILIEGVASLDQFTQKTRIQCSKATSLEAHRMKLSPTLEIVLLDISEQFVGQISVCLSSFKGSSKVRITYHSKNGVAKFALPVSVSVCDELIEKVSSLEGVRSCKPEYRDRALSI